MELMEGEGYLGVIATFLQPLLKSLYASLLKYRVHVKNLFLEFDSTGLNAFIYSFSVSRSVYLRPTFFVPSWPHEILES